MKTIDELVGLVIKWSSDRKILQNGNIETQCLKLISEVGELADNIAKEKDVKDDIGDILVLLINIAWMFNSKIETLMPYSINYDIARPVIYESTKKTVTGDIFKCIKNLMKSIFELAYHIDDFFLSAKISQVIESLFYICEEKNTTLQECLNIAYNDIKDRKGTTLPKGCFVKE